MKLKGLTRKKNIKKIGNNFLEYIRNFDQFGKPVGLTINGEGEYKTVYGSIVSLCLVIYILYILVI